MSDAGLRSVAGIVLPCLYAVLGPQSSALAAKPLPRFDRVVIDADFPGGYQVEVADVNGDQRPDIVALGGGTCAWYENPRWTKRIVTTPRQTPGIISSATADLDGDGKAEIAIAYDFEMNEPTKGQLALAVQGDTPEAPWVLGPVRTQFFGSIHRLRWGDVDGDGRLDLVIASLFGRKAKAPTYDQDPATLLVMFHRMGDDPKAGRWTSKTWLVDFRPVLHAIEVRDIDDDGRAEILTADNRGVTRYELIDFDGGLTSRTRPLAPGAAGAAPARGSSEVHLGRLADGRRFLATIDPWHGHEVAVCFATDPEAIQPFGPRTVLDATLAAGHALWVADGDGDGDDEVFAGHRGQGHRVSAYDFDGTSWNRTVLDTEIAAQDLRGGDLDGDGTPDVVAIGGATHNVVWYRFR